MIPNFKDFFCPLDQTNAYGLIIWLVYSSFPLKAVFSSRRHLTMKLIIIRFSIGFGTFVQRFLCLWDWSSYDYEFEIMWFSNWTSWPLLWRGVAPWFLYKLGRGWMMNSCSTFDKLTFVAVTFLFPHSWWRNNFNNRKFFKQLQFQLWLHVTYAMNIFSASLWVGRWGLCDVSLKNSWSWQSSEEPWLILVD